MKMVSLKTRSLAATLALTLSLGVFAASKFEVVELSAAEAKALLEKPPAEGLLVLDVRTPEEFAQGHLSGAVLADYKSSDFEAQLKKLDRSKPVLLYCRTGNRSGKSLPTLQRLGFGKIYHFTGGTTAWKKAGYPEEKGKNR
jgi:rhodanese-related sulfurtransferase